MANWDLVIPYSEESEQWLKENNREAPPVLPGNRWPTTADMKWALAQQGNLNLDYPQGYDDFYIFEKGANKFSICIRGFNWDNDDALAKTGSFTIRWMGELQAAVLTALSQRCGQLIMWPDTGDPPIIFSKASAED